MAETKSDTIAVIGAGLMGGAIAEVFASARYPVAIFDPNPAALEAALTRSRVALAGASTLAAHSTLAAAVAEADYVFECGPEKLDLKQRIFSEACEAAPARTVFASNTSVIPITEISAGLPCRSRVLGAHWWNPAHLVPLVEVVPTKHTEPVHVQSMIELLIRVGKAPVRIDHDIPGFVGNRLQFALWREAQALVAAGVCDAETLDTIVKTSFGPRLSVLGPMENADLIGLDLTLDIERTVLPALDRGAEPNSLLQTLVDQGRLGFKSNAGFRTWTPESIAECRQRLTDHLANHFNRAT